MRRILTATALCLLLSTHLFPENGWFSFGLEAKIDTVFTAVDPFPAKPQPDGGIGFNLEFTPLSFLGIGASLGYHWTGTSNLDGGFLYRAYSGGDLRLFLSLRYLTLVQNDSITLLLGSNQGAVARLDRYELTTLYFFYMGAFVQPFLELGFNRYPPASIQFSLPLSYYVRKDVDLNLAVGLGVSFKMAPFRKSWK